MSNQYLGEIRMVSFNYAPSGWALCNGQLLTIAQNDALFQLIGTTYGGNGSTTFALPDLRGRVPIHAGQGPGLSPYAMGEAVGVETVILATNQLPVHNHSVGCVSGGGNQAGPSNNLPAVESTGTSLDYSNASADSTMNSSMIGTAGSGQAHTNIQPVLCVNFIISLTGTFPVQS
jgi:microcystin-dependent protein